MARCYSPKSHCHVNEEEDYREITELQIISFKYSKYEQYFHYLLGLGSNSGNRLNKIRQAVEEISSACMTTLLSPIYESQALLPKGAPISWNMPYLNAILSIVSKLHPYEILKAIKLIEKNMGRNLKAPKWAPRIIDIDILLVDIVSLPKTALMPEIIQYAMLAPYLNVGSKQKCTVASQITKPIVYNELDLSTPHPEMLKRDFVLIPAISIAPYMIHPVTKRTLKAELINNTNILTNSVILYAP